MHLALSNAGIFHMAGMSVVVHKCITDEKTGKVSVPNLYNYPAFIHSINNCSHTSLLPVYGIQYYCHNHEYCRRYPFP